MPATPRPHNSLEILEARIAPASVVATGTFRIGAAGAATLLKAGEGLSTGGEGGSYLLFVEAGEAIIFTTDLNLNGALEPDEITGIAAGDGLQLISFVDIHGDIVTNLKPNGFLSDSDSNAANDPPPLGGDGRVLLNSRIDKIELRSLTVADVPDVNGDGAIDQIDVNLRMAPSRYSIFGNIYAGAGFGTEGGGLIIDDSGAALQAAYFTGGSTVDYYIGGTNPAIGSIKVGTAASNDFFSFGASPRGFIVPPEAGSPPGTPPTFKDIQGYLVPFIPAAGVAGGSIAQVKAVSTTTLFSIVSLEAGNGGVGAAGGDIRNIQLHGDDIGGYTIIAGNGGDGPNGGNGGSILNFVELGATTAYTLLKSGDGGRGLTGRGGDAGRIVLGDFMLSAGMNIVLGKGGDGFTAGGNGAGLPSAIINSPDIGIPFTNNFVGSKHDLTSSPLGSQAQIDFNGDGIPDYVITTSTPHQLLVGLGSGLNHAFDQIISLDAVAAGEALTVGDFNGDGHDDIAVGSSQTGSAAGIFTFLSVFEDRDGNGSLESFAGFTRGIHTPLPSLFTYNGSPFVGFLNRSANPITDMAAGDFNGDGLIDLAVTATYYHELDQTAGQVLIILVPNVEDGLPTGQFYADFGTPVDNTQNPPAPANPLLPFIYIADDLSTAQIEASALSVAGGVSRILHRSAAGGGDELFVFNYYDDPLDPLDGNGSIAILSFIDVGQVDTDRDPTRLSLQDATIADFALIDFDSPDRTGPDGILDVMILVDQPDGFMISLIGEVDTMTGEPTGTFLIASETPGTDQQRGIRIGNNGLGVGDTFVAIEGIDLDGDNILDEVAVLSYGGAPYYSIKQLEIAPNVTTVAGGNQFGVTRADAPHPFNIPSVNGAADSNIVAFDIYPIASGLFEYGIGRPTTSALSLHQVEFRTNLGGATGTITLANYTINITTGDGGASLTGAGGNAGSIGNGNLTTTGGVARGSVEIIYPISASTAERAVANLVAGRGGNGFTRGGTGGEISGLSITSQPNATLLDDASFLYAGSGGIAISGPGGNGGGISSVAVERGFGFFAGDGGDGAIGGTGGSITGNGRAGFFDTRAPILTMEAGDGGFGTKRGGNGGSITKWKPSLPATTAGVSGFLLMTAGDGGSAVSGRGGHGGSISDSSPLSDDNAMVGEILLRAGDAGNGLSGGNGGSITNFVNLPTIPDNPTILTVIAGNGGSGISGRGGIGGDVTNVKTPSTATGTSFTGYTFSRMLAGEGGGSSGNIGGRGGSIVNVDVGATGGSIAVVAGAGGHGLRVGGSGGSVLNTVITSGPDGSGTKALVVAGAGGDASAFMANPNDPTDVSQKAFGGTIGRGGNGGSIIGFTQRNGLNFSNDLIGGNGGNTFNYGNFNDTRAFVGRGGSITNVTVAGSIGSFDPTRPIKAYNDTDGNGTTDEPLAEWVSRVLRDVAIPSGLGDGLGNVGIVVGAAGRIKAIDTGGTFESQPAPGAAKLTGKLTNLTARILTSAIAGDVNSIAAIQVAKNINISSGLVGADKATVGVIEYRSPSGTVVPTPQLGGGLIDGAFISSNLVPEIDGKPRVFRL